MTIRTVASTGSTNADLAAAAEAGLARDGDWLRAVEQTAGRGRQGRPWLGERGSLFASCVIALHRDDPPATTLALVCGLALLAAIDRHAPPGAPVPSLKWPNDVMLDEAKLAGILLERQGARVIAGFGVNVGSAPEVDGRRTVALTDAGWTVRADGLVETLAGTLAIELSAWRTSGAGVVVRRWQERAHPLGAPLSVHGAYGAATVAGRITGYFAGLSPDGALRLADEAGRVVEVTGGDVALTGSPVADAAGIVPR